MNKYFHIFLTAACLATAPAAGAATVLDVRESLHDNAIIYPESFETDVQRMQHDWYLRRYAAIDSAADRSPDTPVTDEELIRRLQAIPTTIEMPYNSVVRSYIDMYTQRRRQLVENMLGLSHYYMPIFEEALDRYDMPMELKYLPVIESALNPTAVSRVGATGLWQFMLPTATGQGLEVNTLVDERRDPYKATDAAVRYLKQLHATYGDWSLAIAAYNCGPGNVNKALRRLGSGASKKDFWAIYPFLPAETRGYVPAFIAATYVMNYYGKHNISPALARRPMVVDSVHVCRRVHFEQIADVMGISLDELRTLNPQYRKDVIPGHIKPYPLVLPSLQAYAFVANEDSIVAHNAAKYATREVVEPATGAAVKGSDASGEYIDETTVKYHKVRKDETLSSIARRYGVTTAALRSTNKLGRKSGVRVGQSLKIVTTTRRYVPKAPAPDTTRQIEPAPLDTLQPGPIVIEADTAASTQAAAEATPQAAQVARAMASSPKSEAPKPKAESKSSGSKQAAGTSASKASSRASNHTVQKGDNLYRISKQYGVSVADLRAANGLKNDNLQIGQKLKIPAKSTSSRNNRKK